MAEEKVVLTIKYQLDEPNFKELFKFQREEEKKINVMLKDKLLKAEDYSKLVPLALVVEILQELSDEGTLSIIHLNSIFGYTTSIIGRAVNELIEEGKLIEKEGKLVKTNGNNQSQD